MNIKETIGIYPGTLSDEFCDRLIEIFHEKKDLQYKGEMASGVDPTVKDIFSIKELIILCGNYRDMKRDKVIIWLGILKENTTNFVVEFLR
jgi:hypothetical protein